MTDELRFTYDDQSHRLVVHLPTAGQVDRSALDAVIGQYPATRELALRHVPAELALPPAAFELHELKKLELSNEGLLSLPTNLEQLEVTSLDLDDCVAGSMPVLPKIEALEFRTKDVASDVAALVTRCPNLKSLVLTGSELDAQTLPDAVTQFKNLEALRLTSCGISTLPPSLSKLSLRRLTLSFLPMTELPEVVSQLRQLEDLELIRCKLTGLPTSLSKLRLKRLVITGNDLPQFPEVICQIRSLETLITAERFAKLPEGLSALTVLRELSLDGSLNNGPTVYAIGDVSKLKDLPLVIGSLIRLERLNLRECGVRDGPNLEQVFSKLLRLKKLNLGHSAVTSLGFLSTCVALEELELGSVRSLKTLEGIEVLKRLHTVSLEGVSRLRNLEVLRELPELKKLDLEHAEIKDVSALFDLDVDLKADDELGEKYQARAALRGVPSFEELLAALETTDAAAFEKTLEGLAARSAAASGKKSALLAAMTGVALDEAEDEDEDDENDDDEREESGAVIELPAFEKALNVHVSKVSPLTLAKIFSELYRSVYTNVPVTLTLAREVVARGDDEAQLQLVEGFERANAYYDAGHRQFEDTVQDVLLDDILPGLRGAALTRLVTWASNDALALDAMSAYFLPALERGDAAQRKAVIERLEKYLTDRESEKLISKLEGSKVPEVISAVAALKKSLERTMALKARADALNAELRSDDPERVTKALREVYLLNADERVEVRRGLNTALRDRALPMGTHLELMQFMKKIDQQRDLREAFFTAAAAHGVDAMRRAPHAVPDAELSRFLRLTVSEASDDASDVLVPITKMGLKAWAIGLDGTTAEKERSNDLRDLLLDLEFSTQKLSRAISLLSRLTVWEPDPLEPGDDRNEPEGINWSDFASVVADATSDEDEGWPTLKLLARHVHKLRLEGQDHERVLAQLLGVCSQGKDEEGLALMLALVPASPSWDILAFNLAGVRALAGDRAGALAMARRALELGKPPSQFRSDTDFKKLLKDADFTKLLAEFDDEG